MKKSSRLIFIASCLLSAFIFGCGTSLQFSAELVTDKAAYVAGVSDTITITNRGAASATFGTISRSSASDPGFLGTSMSGFHIQTAACGTINQIADPLGGTCTTGSTLAPGASCTVVFVPIFGCATGICNYSTCGISAINPSGAGSLGVRIPYTNGADSTTRYVTTSTGGYFTWACKLIGCS